MKIIAGIDHHSYSAALQLLRRLRFRSAEVSLVHVVESMMPDRGFPAVSPDHPLAQVQASFEREGWEELERASLELGHAYPSHRDLLMGNSARLLIEAARKFEAELIAVGSAQKGRWGSMFFGSVTKALSSESEQSILVAKQIGKSEEPLKVVFATDQSPYADQCLDTFLKWGVQGISHATVVTVVPPDLPANQVDDATKRNELDCQKLEAAGIESKPLVRHGVAQLELSQVMDEQGADLLIMGARGHGYWQRVWLGSVAHHLVVSTPHNVLVIRARKESG